MSLDNDVEVLSRIHALAGFEPDALRLLAFAANRMTYQVGEKLYDAGDRAAGAIAVLSGQLSVINIAIPEKSIVDAGQLIDEMAMYVELERAGAAYAAELTSIFELTREMVVRVLMEFPGSALRVRDNVSSRLSHLSAELGIIGQRLKAIQPGEG